MKVTTKKEAKQQGLKRYFTGKPCKHGHVSERYVISSNCVACCNCEASREKHRESVRKWRKANPEKHRESREKWNKANPDKYLEHMNKWSKVNPEKYRENKLKSKYGISVDQFNTMIAEQDGRCAACRVVLLAPFPCGKGIPPNYPCVDHCHATGLIRGILCNKCNRGIGHFDDSPELLRAAIQYLERSYISNDN